jgi:SAM-dependent methyltransferase
MSAAPDDKWMAGDAYEQYMGRWSRPLARAFIDWLAPARAGHWLDVGCGTGALTSAICARGEPASVVACDPSEPFIAHARRQLTAETRASFLVAGADALPRREGGFDMIVSGLVLNFLAGPEVVVASLRERVRPGGTVAATVWDYAEGMEFLRCFWEEAVAADPRAAALDEGRRFPLCRPDALAAVFRAGGLVGVETSEVSIPTTFADFDDYWTPFLRGTGPAPSYVATLPPSERDALEGRLRRRLALGADGRLHLRARAWAVRGGAA